MPCYIDSNIAPYYIGLNIISGMCTNYVTEYKRYAILVLRIIWLLWDYYQCIYHLVQTFFLGYGKSSINSTRSEWTRSECKLLLIKTPL